MPEHRVGSIEEFPSGEGRVVKIAGKALALFNLGGEILAIDDGCPHMRASLAGGVLRGRTVLCGWHGWQFDLDSGACLNVDWAKVRRYPVAIRGREVIVTYEPPAAPEPVEEEIPRIVWKNPPD